LALGNTNRLGKKNGRGFYRYQGGKDTGVDESIYAELGLPPMHRPLHEDVIVERCMLAMINEAARILADGIVAVPGDVDLGMIMGTGFPPFRGGLLRYADSLGTPAIVEKLGQLEKQHGARFAVAP